MHSTGAADAGTLHVVTIRSRALAVSADSKDSASLVTEIITSPHALTEVFGDRLQSSRSWLFVESSQPPLHCIASVLQTLYSLLRRTIVYALGRSGRARRDVPAFLPMRTLYVAANDDLPGLLDMIGPGPGMALEA